MGGDADVPEVVDLGLVPDEVLLLTGRPQAVPGPAWTPWLASLPAAEQAAVRARAVHALREDGLLDREGRPLGVLGEVAQVVRAAVAVVSFETELPGAATTHGAFVIAPDRVLVSVQVPRRGGHQLRLCSPTAAIVVLALGLDPLGLASGEGGVVHLLEPTDLPARHPLAHRRSTVRLAQAVAGPPRRELLCTVLAQDDGVHLVRALPEGSLRVRSLAPDELVEVACALLGATDADGRPLASEEVAA